MRTLTRCALMGGVVMALVACGQRSPGVGAPRQSSADSLYILVDNQSFLDATVYTNFVGSTRRRLGDVVGQQRRAYAIRWSASEMYFVVDFVGSRRPLNTREFVFRRGEAVELRIPSNARQTGNLIITRR